MKRALFLLTAMISTALGGTGTFSAQVSKTSSTDLINVDGTWRKDLPNRLKVSLRSSRELPGRDLFLKAYFFDADGKLLREQKGPSPIWTGTKKGIEEVTFPEVLKPGQLETVFVALPDSVKKMKTVIVVFGQGDDLSCDVYPNSKKVEDFAFPEKESVLKKPAGT